MRAKRVEICKQISAKLQSKSISEIKTMPEDLLQLLLKLRKLEVTRIRVKRFRESKSNASKKDKSVLSKKENQGKTGEFFKNYWKYLPNWFN